MITFKNFLQEETAESLAKQFMAAYGDEAQSVYYNMRDSVLFIVSKYRDFSHKAADLNNSFKTMSKGEFEHWVILNYVPFLKKHKFPKVFSSEWGKAQDEFSKWLTK